MKTTTTLSPTTSKRTCPTTSTRHNLQHLNLRKIVKENHGAQISCVAFNDLDPKRRHMVATVGAHQLNVYDNSHMGNHLDLSCHFINHATDFAKGGRLDTACWLPPSHPETNDARIATAGDAEEISIVSLQQSMVVGLLHGHERSIYHVTHIPNEPNMLLSSSMDQTIRLWDVDQERCLAIIRIGSVGVLAVSPDQSTLLVGTQSGKVEVVDFVELLRTVSSTETTDLPVTVEHDQVTKLPNFKGSSRRIGCIKFAKLNPEDDQDEKTTTYRAIIHRGNGAVVVFDLAAMAIEREIKVPGCTSRATNDHPPGNTVDVSPCGQFLCCGNHEGVTYVYEVGTGKRVSKLEISRVKGAVTNCLFTPECDGVLLATEGPFLWRWDLVKPTTKKAKTGENDDDPQTVSRENGVRGN